MKALRSLDEKDGYIDLHGISTQFYRANLKETFRKRSNYVPIPDSRRSEPQRPVVLLAATILVAFAPGKYAAARRHRPSPDPSRRRPLLTRLMIRHHSRYQGWRREISTDPGNNDIPSESHEEHCNPGHISSSGLTRKVATGGTSPRSEIIVRAQGYVYQITIARASMSLLACCPFLYLPLWYYSIHS